MYKYSNNIFTVQIKAPHHLNNQNPTQNIPPKIQRPVPPPKPQETQPANISSVRKAPDPGRLLTKDPHPFPVAVSFLRSLHVVPLAQAARLPPSPGLHFPPRPLASPFAPTPPPPLHPFPLPGALPRPASSLLLPPASAPPPPHPPYILFLSFIYIKNVYSRREGHFGGESGCGGLRLAGFRMIKTYGEFVFHKNKR